MPRQFKCPMCGNKDYQVKHLLIPMAPELWLVDAKTKHQSKVETWVCSGCGAAFLFEKEYGPAHPAESS